MMNAITILAGVISIALNGIVPPPIETQRPARFLTCPTTGECDGGYVQHGNRCVCLTTETDPLTGEISDPDNLPASQKERMVGCCTDYQKWADWRLITDPVGSCIIILSHQLFSGQWMSNIDLGLVDLLNDYCCDSATPVTTQSSGECPYCSWTCGGTGDTAIPDVDGCDTFCGE